jgi:hypothetical protein
LTLIGLRVMSIKVLLFLLRIVILREGDELLLLLLLSLAGRHAVYEVWGRRIGGWRRNGDGPGK